MKNLLVLSLGVIFLLTACDLRTRSNEEDDAGDAHILTKNIRMNGVQTIHTNISIKAGRLTVTGGARDLMEADIRYGKEKWKPDINFSEDGQTGQLSIEQPEMSTDLNLGDNDNTWTIKLNDRVTQDLSCEIGAGQTDLNLQGLKLSHVRIDAGVGEHHIDLRNCSVPELDINAGVGQVSIDLTGQWHNDLVADISGGIGELNLKLPRNVGIRLRVNGGLGNVNAPGLNRDGRTYTNDLYDNAEYKLDFDIKAGLGSIDVDME